MRKSMTARSKSLGTVIGLLAIGLFIRSASGQRAAPARHAVFVGGGECAECHRGPDMGFQQCRWLVSKHARAYAALAMPESQEIARLSGIPEEPQKAALCLGCHATGADAEDWEKDDTFHLEDGVQCEKCHGAGSEYMDEDIMTDPDAARTAGLLMPTKNDCLNCHRAKGTHDDVLGRGPVDIDEAWEEIAHPTPEAWETLEEAEFPTARDPSAPKYTGVMKCAECHRGPDMGYQFSRWRMSKHAQAYAVLGTPRAMVIAEEMGVEGSPLISQECLSCHSTGHMDSAGGASDTFSIDEGVGCESCHGAGSRFSVAEIMRNPQKARESGLQQVTRSTCMECHAEAHGKPFDYEKALQWIAHPLGRPPEVNVVRYKTPISLAIRPDGREAYVPCEASGSVAVVDVADRTVVAEIVTGRQPNSVTFQRDGRVAYVSNRLDDSITVIDTATRAVVQTLAAGDEPHGLALDPSGRFLYVANTGSGDVSVIDTSTGREDRRLEASRAPWKMAVSPDGDRLSITNALPKFGEFRTSSTSEVTRVGLDSRTVEHRTEVPGANLLTGIAWHPSGEFAFVLANRTKNLVPMTRLLQGWTITNSLAIITADGTVDQLLLDEPNLCFADPADVVITPDGNYALVASSGTNRIAVVDLTRLLAIVRESNEYERKHVLPNHLGLPTEFIVKHIATGTAPRGLAVTPDGSQVLVANSLDDSVTFINTDDWSVAATVQLGGPTVITKTRHGERLFHSADITFHRQFSCHTCHPDGHVNGMTFDIEPDGIGVSPVDNRTLRGILDTAPFKWEGTNPSLQRQCGPRLAVFFTRIQPFDSEQLDALDTYICTIPRPPNRHRPLGAELTDAQRRGKAVFERETTNDGRAIPVNHRCVHCHFPPLYTNRTIQDVGTKMEFDRDGRFDVPHLNNIYDSAPYLHNGVAHTLEEIWTVYNPYDQHGVTNDLTKDQLNHLIEFLKTL